MSDQDVSYPRVVGLIFIFNIILGTGVLTMPAVFAKAGYILGIIVLLGLCFISFIQTTFIIEALANANYVFRRSKRLQGVLDSSSEMRSLLNSDVSNDEDEDDNEIPRVPVGKTGAVNEGFDGSNEIIGDNLSPIKDDLSGSEKNNTSGSDSNEESNEESLFDISKKFEIGSMTKIFFTKILSRLFFLSIIIYLYGDIVIYNTMMAKSLREMICTKNHCNVSDVDHLECWDNSSLSRHTVYQLCVLGFVVILTPLIYAGIKKNQGIQIITIVLRWIAFSSMIGITIRIFVLGKATGKPEAVNFLDMPKLFGICVYAFMCHHSLPSMIAPIRNKRNLIAYIAGDYFVLIIIYIVVALTGIFAFHEIDDVYTLNFQHNGCSAGSGKDNPAVVPILDYFLPTFPIFTLFSSYTVIALTLINNLRVLLEKVIDLEQSNIRHMFPLIAIVPPLAISLFTEDVSSVVSYVGSYSGGLIQYVFPCLLVYYSRKFVLDNYIKKEATRRNDNITAQELYEEQNPFASPFQSKHWVTFTLIWWILSLGFVTLDHVIEIVNSARS